MELRFHKSLGRIWKNSHRMNKLMEKYVVLYFNKYSMGFIVEIFSRGSAPWRNCKGNTMRERENIREECGRRTDIILGSSPSWNIISSGVLAYMKYWCYRRWGCTNSFSSSFSRSSSFPTSFFVLTQFRARITNQFLPLTTASPRSFDIRIFFPKASCSPVIFEYEMNDAFHWRDQIYQVDFFTWKLLVVSFYFTWIP